MMGAAAALSEAVDRVNLSQSRKETTQVLLAALVHHVEIERGDRSALQNRTGTAGDDEPDAMACQSPQIGGESCWRF